MLQFVTLIFFYFSFGNVIFDIIKFANNISGLFRTCKQFFSIFLICPLQRKNNPYLMSKIIALLVYHANCNFVTVTVDCVVKVPNFVNTRQRLSSSSLELR